MCKEHLEGCGIWGIAYTMAIRSRLWLALGVELHAGWEEWT
jgi:hypothetical protein